MINVLFFIEKLAYNGSIGGAEKVLINLVNHMDAEKYQITVQTVFPDSCAKYFNDNIRYTYCYPQKDVLHTLRYRVEAALGFSYMLHVKKDCDIEIAFLESSSTKIMSASKNLTAAKLAWVHCDFDVAIQNKSRYKRKTKRWYDKFDHIVCVSDKCRDSFRKIYGDKHDISVLHNVIDDEEIKVKAMMPLPNGICKKKLTLVTVARFSVPKNYPRLLKTIYRLKKDGFDFKLWVIGDGEQREMIERIITDNELSDYVTLCGYQENPYPFIYAADLLLCSSSYEGFSTFITEGLILGKPIVTTNCSGMTELLGDSEYGVITENDDNAFYEGVYSVLKNKDTELPRLAHLAQIRGAVFSTEQLVRENEKYYQKALELKRGIK